MNTTYNKKWLLNRITLNGLAMVLLFSLWGILSYFPGLDQGMTLWRFSWEDLLSAIIIILLIETLCSVGENVEKYRRLVSGKPYPSHILVKDITYLLSIIIAFFGFRKIILPYLGPYYWIYTATFTAAIVIWLVFTLRRIYSNSTAQAKLRQPQTSEKPFEDNLSPSSIEKDPDSPYSSQASQYIEAEPEEVLIRKALTGLYTEEESMASQETSPDTSSHAPSSHNAPHSSEYISAEDISLEDLTLAYLFEGSNLFHQANNLQQQCKQCGSPVEIEQEACEACQAEIENQELSSGLLLEEIRELKEGLDKVKDQVQEEAHLNNPSKETLGEAMPNEEKDEIAEEKALSHLQNGTPAESEDATTPTPQEEVTQEEAKDTPTPADTTAIERTCPNCGASLKFGSLYCTYCFGK